MGLDVIKSYLVGLGFKINKDSFKSAEEALNQTNDSIKKFNDNSNKGFAESSNSLQSLFDLLSSPVIMKSIPSGTLRGVIKDISTAKKLYKEFSNILNKKSNSNKQQTDKKDATKNNKGKNNSFNNTSAKKNNKNTDKSFNKQEFKSPIDNKLGDLLSKDKKSLDAVTKSSEILSNKGGSSILQFAKSGAARLALIVTAAVVCIGAVKKLASFLNKLADQDIGYEKLSRQLWTTKENAKEISSALDTLGASMEDLWLSPTLLKQFNQLRKDSKDLKLPPEFNKNLKQVQGVALEFKRLKQMIGILFQWIGHYILKYAAGPIKNLKNALKNNNEWLKKSIPVIAKILGSIIGILIRIISLIIKIGLFIGKILLPIKSLLQLIDKIKDKFENLPAPIKKILKILFLLINPIILLIGFIDDLFTYFRGGKSIIGSFFSGISSKSTKAAKAIKSILTVLKALLTGGLSLVPWSNYWKKAEETFNNIKDKAKATYSKIKEWSKGKIGKAKDFLSSAKEKVSNFIGGTKSNSTAKYVSSTSNSSTANSNNKISNSNTFNIYGSGDAKSTAKEASKNLTGLSNRNLQGVF